MTVQRQSLEKESFVIPFFIFLRVSLVADVERLAIHTASRSCRGKLPFSFNFPRLAAIQFVDSFSKNLVTLVRGRIVPKVLRMLSTLGVHQRSGGAWKLNPEKACMLHISV